MTAVVEIFPYCKDEFNRRKTVPSWLENGVVTHKSLALKKLYACHEIGNPDRKTNSRNKKNWLDTVSFTVQYDDLRWHIKQVIMLQEDTYNYDPSQR